MFEISRTKNASYRKNKALLYAGIFTFVIALIYILIMGGVPYQFKGSGPDLTPISSKIKDVSGEVKENIDKGRSVINNKE